MQTDYDLAQVRKHEDEIKVQRVASPVLAHPHL
jgi:hypothetical protein